MKLWNSRIYCLQFKRHEVGIQNAVEAIAIMHGNRSKNEGCAHEQNDDGLEIFHWFCL